MPLDVATIPAIGNGEFATLYFMLPASVATPKHRRIRVEGQGGGQHRYRCLRCIGGTFPLAGRSRAVQKGNPPKRAGSLISTVLAALPVTLPSLL